MAGVMIFTQHLTTPSFLMLRHLEVAFKKFRQDVMTKYCIFAVHTNENVLTHLMFCKPELTNAFFDVGVNLLKSLRTFYHIYLSCVSNEDQCVDRST